MQNSKITLDFEKGIVLDPSNPPIRNYHAIWQNRSGLKFLADLVREHELKFITEMHAMPGFHAFLGGFDPLISCAFNWFSVTIVSYLRLVALVELMAKNNWKSPDLVDPANRKVIKDYCTNYVREAIPEIYMWRNKVAAHFAATDPFNDDTLGTLEQSIMNPISFAYPYYNVGMLLWNTQGTLSELPTWALTETYERLQQRYWPEMKLREIPKYQP